MKIHLYFLLLILMLGFTSYCLVKNGWLPMWADKNFMQDKSQFEVNNEMLLKELK